MLSELRRRKFTYLFHCFDLDRNGVLERGDYEQFGQRLGTAFDLAPTSAKYLTIHAETMALWDFVRTIADHDNDDRVSVEEFVAAYARLTDDDEAFQRLLMGYASFIISTGDRSAKGSLDAEEYAAILSSYGIDDGEARAAFAELDIVDGMLTTAAMERAFAEFFRSDDPDAPGNRMMGRL